MAEILVFDDALRSLEEEYTSNRCSFHTCPISSGEIDFFIASKSHQTNSFK